MPIDDEIKEVDHLSMKGSINKVANRTTKYQNQTGLHQFFFFRVLMKNHKDRQNCDSRNSYKHQSFIFELLVCKQPKCHPGISDMG